MNKIEEAIHTTAIIEAARYNNPFDEPAYDKSFYDGFMACARIMLKGFNFTNQDNT